MLKLVRRKEDIKEELKLLNKYKQLLSDYIKPTIKKKNRRAENPLCQNIVVKIINNPQKLQNKDPRAKSMSITKIYGSIRA